MSQPAPTLAQPAATAIGVAAVDRHEPRKGLRVVVLIPQIVAETAVDVAASPVIDRRDYGRRLVDRRSSRQIRRELQNLTSTPNQRVKRRVGIFISSPVQVIGTSSRLAPTITHESAKGCDTSASVREIQRALGRYRGVRGATDICILCDRIGAISKHLSRRPPERAVVGGAKPNWSVAEQTVIAHGRREFLAAAINRT